MKSQLTSLQQWFKESSNEMKNLIFYGVGVALPLIVIVFCAFLVTGHLKSNDKINAQNAKTALADKAQAKLNQSKNKDTFSTTFNQTLSGAFVGDYTSAETRYDYLHNQSPISGLTSLQGDDKDYYISTYLNASSNISGVSTSQFGNTFVATFNYQFSGLTTSNTTNTKTTVYTVYGHKTGDNSWAVDKIIRTAVK